MAKKKVAKKAVRKMKVYFINNGGGGFAGEVSIPCRTTIAGFFKIKMGNDSPANHLIKVNREVVPSTQVLKTGDRITITPTKVQGA